MNIRFAKFVVTLSFLLLTMFYFTEKSNAADIRDDFETDSLLWDTLGTAQRLGDGTMQLTPSSGSNTGTVWLKQSLSPPFSADFKFNIDLMGNGGADGLVVMFNKQKNTVPVNGGGMGFEVGSGYGVEFDTWFNEEWDPSGGHIALFQNSPNHVDWPALDSVNQNDLQDGDWHNVRIEVDTDMARVYMDNQMKLNYKGSLVTTYNGFGFSASTGYAYENHLLDNVVISQRPFVKSVKTTATYAREGDVVPISVNFSKPVNVTGTPQLLLNNGRTAFYTGGSGSSTLTFSYAVHSNDNLMNFNYTAIDDLVFNGGTLVSSDGELVNPVLPPTTSADSLLTNISFLPVASLMFDSPSYSLKYDQVAAASVFGMYSNGTNLPLTSGVVYESSDATVVQIDSNGTMKAVGAGTATIRAYYGESETSASVVVSPLLRFDKGVYNVEKGRTVSSNVYAVYSSSSSVNVTQNVYPYTYSPPGIAMIDASGMIYGNAIGNTVVTATYGGVTATAGINVSEVHNPMRWISVNASRSFVLSPGTSFPVTVFASYADGTEVNVTSMSAIQSSAPLKVAVNGGVISAVALGEADITVSYNGINIILHVDVRPSNTISSLSLDKQLYPLRIGESQPTVLKAVYSNGDVQQISSGFVLISSDPDVVGVDHYILRAKKKGSAAISVNYNGIQAVAYVVVTDGPLGLDTLIRQMNAGIDVNGDGLFDKKDVIIYLTSIPPVYVH